MADYARLKLKCDLCKGRKTLWLGGADYVECAQCNATGVVEVEQHRLQKRVVRVFIPGLQPFNQIVGETRSLFTGRVVGEA